MEAWVVMLISAMSGFLGVIGTMLTLKAKKKQAFAEADGAVLDNKKKEIENQSAYHEIYVKMSEDLERMVNQRLEEKDKIISSLTKRVGDLEAKVEFYEKEVAKRDALISAAIRCKNVAKCPVIALRDEIFDIPHSKINENDEVL